MRAGESKELFIEPEQVSISFLSLATRIISRSQALRSSRAAPVLLTLYREQ